MPDESEEIVDALNYLKKHDLIVTSGGIGPTHDDLTYESIAGAFGLSLELHQETVDKMKRLMSDKRILTGDAHEAQMRMATLPTGQDVEYIYTRDDLWVPVVGIKKQVYILPGVPQLFQTMFKGLLNGVLKDRIVPDEFVRMFVKTSMRESEIAPHLSKLQKEAGEIKIGSYPHMGQGFNTVSIIGREKDREAMIKIVESCVKNLKGEEITAEQEVAYSEVVSSGFDD